MPVTTYGEIQSLFSCIDTPVADNVYVKKLRKKFLQIAKNDDKSGVRYPIDVKSAGFRYRVEASRWSSHTEELCNNETVRMWIIYIYIYIYILNRINFESSSNVLICFLLLLLLIESNLKINATTTRQYK